MARHPYPDRCHPELVKRANALVIEAAARGHTFKLYFGYRDQDEQNALYAQGRYPLAYVNQQRFNAGLPPITEEQNKRTVTNAKYGESQHTVDPARAVDGVLVGLNGEMEWDTGVDLDRDGVADYKEIGKIGGAVGLVWGGSWTTKLKDWGHFELPKEV